MTARATRTASHLGAAVAAALAFATGLAAASSPVAAEAPRLAAAPSPRRYVALDDLAAQTGAQLLVEAPTATYRLRRGDRTVAVTPGLGVALVGSDLVALDREVVVHYGRAYVPCELVRSIERAFGVAAVRPRPTTPEPRLPPAPPPAPRCPLAIIQRICIDPGHGGKDPGAISRGGLREKHVVFDTALKLGEELRRRGFDVVMTRDSDEFIELENRPAIAARQNADVFVAVHANAMGDRSVRGVEIFYCDARYSSVDLAASAARAGRHPHPDDLGANAALPPGANQAALQMLFEEYYHESAELAKALDRSFTRAGMPVRSLRTAGFRVLRLAETPAVLVEIGFLTNPSEEALLRTDAYRRKAAQAIADGLAAYRDSLEAAQR
jgi:N-acetylmuramoyl-L-alanine amidase